MSVQIGNIIKKVMEDKRVSPSELASRLGVHPGSISRIFNYKHMHSSLLQKISQALGHDFFKYFTQDIRVERSEVEKQMEEMKKQMELLRKENGYLKQINELLTLKSGGIPSGQSSQEG
ncbi:MAG: helix-turn-helix domain-containing protein [Bacteroidetes bacterium]|nr:helix-turn-helix domain-containing protein [Bacteroidota bacterium]